MDVSPAGLVQVAVAQSQARTSQDVQVAVLKKALSAEASGALALLQALPPVSSASAATGPQPLANGGTLGTQLNWRA
jgi:hypothetical protein